MKRIRHEVEEDCQKICSSLAITNPTMKRLLSFWTASEMCRFFIVRRALHESISLLTRRSFGVHRYAVSVIPDYAFRVSTADSSDLKFAIWETRTTLTP